MNEPDLVQRLRLTDPEFQRTDPIVLNRQCWEAADEIEELRAKVALLQGVVRAVRLALPRETKRSYKATS